MSLTLLTNSRHIKQKRQWCNIARLTQVRLHTRRTHRLSSHQFHSWTWAANSLNWDTSSTCRMGPHHSKNEMEFPRWRRNALRLWSTRTNVSSTGKPLRLTCRLWGQSVRYFSKTTQVNPILQSCLRRSVRQKRSVKKLKLSETSFPSYAISKSNRDSLVVETEYSARAGDMESLELTMQTQI